MSGSLGDILADKNIIIKGADVFTQGGFTQVPNSILKAKGISPNAKLVYTMLLSYAWHNNFCFPGQVRLGEDLGMSERSVRTQLQELQKKGYVKITRQGLGKPNLYELFLTATKAPTGKKKKS